MRSSPPSPRLLFARLASLAFACVLALTLVACDSNDDDGDDGDVTGDPIGSSSVNFSSGGTGFNGSAIFATEADFDPQAEGFSIILFRVTSSDTLLVGIGRGTSAVPGAGTYALADASGNVDADEFTGFYFEFTASTSRFGASTGGSFTIDSQSSDRLTGSFDMQGESSDFRNLTAPPVPFSGTGTFEARRATQNNIDELDRIFDDLGGF
jgi:hypothetical protein